MTEPEARREFENFVPPTLFTLNMEVRGEFGPAKPIKKLFRAWGSTAKKGLRIDYVLTPTPTLEAAGWELGSIGVEVKVGEFAIPYDIRIGRILSQLFDCQSAVFTLPDQRPTQLSMIFLFARPYHRFCQLPASIMMQEGIGLVKGRANWPESFALVHGNGNSPILAIKDGLPFYRRPQFGKAAGSR
ncbi:MAG: hypothetical protein WCS65_03975 [Verrucomicrobiae bacterium]